jgi:spore maturation protein CgeB
MKILCVFGKHQYGRSAIGEGIEHAAFIPTLRRLGHEVLHFESWDRTAYPNFAELNGALLECVKRERPHVLLAVQRDCEIWTETLATIRASGTATIAWTTDDSWKYREVSRFIGRHYDAITTTYPEAVAWYRQDGIQNVLLTQWAANAHWLRDPLPAAECKYGVSFVGAAYGRRREVVDALQTRGVPVECFGDGWPNGPVAAEDIPRIFQSSRISLNFSDAYKANTPRQIKARTFEVPGAGGLLLTESAPGLERFYELGSEIVSCRSVDEMVMQIRRLEGNSQGRDAIAWAGNIRTRAEHTYDHRLTGVIELALAAHGGHTDRSSQTYFPNAVADHQVGAILRQFKRVLRASCIAIWGADRGTRAARRAIFEFSWRVLGERTFASRGLPGRLFPEV